MILNTTALTLIKTSLSQLSLVEAERALAQCVDNGHRIQLDGEILNGKKCTY